MKKIILTVLISTLLPLVVFSAPFGLKMGMTLEEIKSACNGIKPKFYERNIYFITPAKKHPLFETYGVFVDDKHGLYKLRVVTREILTRNDGAELKTAFQTALKTISKTYGKPDIKDISPNEAIDNSWFDKLRNEKINPKATWEKTNKLLESDLEKIELKIIPDDRNELSFDNIGAVVLNYYFRNANTVEDEQDNVF